MTDPLVIYLHDHLAGSNFAVELLESWESDYAGESLGVFATALRQEVQADQAQLSQIIERVGAPPHTIKELVAWVAEKASRFKLRHEAMPTLGIFEGLETLALGILGKLSLWNALAAVSAWDARLRTVDYPTLKQRAQEQHAQVEAVRMKMAATVFACSRA